MSPSTNDSALHSALQTLHAELRAQVAEARRLAANPSGDAAPVGLETVHAFFSGVWPHYVAAKQALVTRLAGRDGAVDGLLDEVRRGIDEQRVLVDRLVTLTTAGTATSTWSDRAVELGAVSATLERRFDEELSDEERLVHPALGRLLDLTEQGDLASAFGRAAQAAS